MRYEDGKKLWEAYDLDGSGYLERGEGTAFFKDIYKRKLELANSDQRSRLSKIIKNEKDLDIWAQSCFTRMDRNQDGRLAWDEFYANASGYQQKRVAAMAKSRITDFFRGWAEGLRVRVKIYRMALAEIEAMEERKALFESKKARQLRVKFNERMLQELKKKNPNLPAIQKSSMYRLKGEGDAGGGEMLRRYERLQSFMKKDNLTEALKSPNKKWRRWVSMRHTLDVRRKTSVESVLAELREKRAARAKRTTSGGVPEINLNFVTAMMDEIAVRKKVDRQVCLGIITKAKAILSKELNVVNYTIKSGTRVTVVGDLHGQIPDLLHLFHLNGLPSPRNAYIFNGDWVDRGPQGCEVVLIIFAFKILFPRSVFLNRGNHEAVDINDFSGFLDECKEKYDEEVYTEFNEAFASCPLVTLLNKKIFVVHGGLPRIDCKVEELYKIKRFITEIDYEHPEHCILADLIWSDPEEYLQGRVPNTRRGAGQLFGPDVLETFLDINDLEVVIRSHEAKQEGYEYMWDNQLITVFSASNYCGTQGNDGAVLVYESDLKHKIITWNLSDTSHLALSGTHGRFNLRVSLKAASGRNSSVKSTLITKLSRLIQNNRLSLIDSFEKVSHNGIIKRSKWAAVLRDVLQVKVPFLMFQRMLGVPRYGVDANFKGPIDYMQWLVQFSADRGKSARSPGGDEKTRQRLSLTMDGLSSDSTSVQKSPRSPKSLSLRVSKMEEYMKRVKLRGDRKSRKLTNLEKFLFEHTSRITSLFRYFDFDGDGVIVETDLLNGLKSISEVYKENFTKEEIEQLVQAVFNDEKKQANGITIDAFAACLQKRNSKFNAESKRHSNTSGGRQARGRGTNNGIRVKEERKIF